MVVHEGEAGSALIALRVEVPGLRSHPIIAIALLDDLNPYAGRRDDPRHVRVEFLAERVHLTPLHQPSGLHDHIAADEIEHPTLVVLSPATPVAALAPLARHCPRRRLVRQLIVQRVLRRLLRARARDRQEDRSEEHTSHAYEQRSQPLHGLSSLEGVTTTLGRGKRKAFSLSPAQL